MNYRIELKVKDLLEQNHITQKRLAEIANMRESTISDIVRGTRTVINFEHLSRIAEALDIQDISQLIDFVAPQGAEGCSWEKDILSCIEALGKREFCLQELYGYIDELQAKHPEHAGKVKFYIGDVRNIRSVEDAVQGVDYIFHAAAWRNA